eukprot:1724758-Pleurochrysis_carterae.AAC.1
MDICVVSCEDTFEEREGSREISMQLDDSRERCGQASRLAEELTDVLVRPARAGTRSCSLSASAPSGRETSQIGRARPISSSAGSDLDTYRV